MLPFSLLLSLLLLYPTFVLKSRALCNSRGKFRYLAGQLRHCGIEWGSASRVFVAMELWERKRAIQIHERRNAAMFDQIQS